MTLDKVLMPIPEDHPSVFDREWPLRVADIDLARELASWCWSLATLE